MRVRMRVRANNHGGPFVNPLGRVCPSVNRVTHQSVLTALVATHFRRVSVAQCPSVDPFLSLSPCSSFVNRVRLLLLCLVESIISLLCYCSGKHQQSSILALLRSARWIFTHQIINKYRRLFIFYSKII